MSPAARVLDARCEVAVVGAGLLGLATARSLTRRGIGVVVLEAVEPGHDQAGSKGTARIFRLGYPEPHYVEMAALALEGWRALEARSGRTLLHRTGQLTFGPGSTAVADALHQAGVECQPLTAADLRERFPDWRIEGPAFLEPDSGVLSADACLDALRDDSCATFPVHTHTTVTTLEDDGEGVTVHLLDGERLRADVVVDCAGTHATRLLSHPCAVAQPPTVQQVAYFRVGSTPQPVFIEWGPDMLYGLPVPHTDHFKVAQHLPGAALEPDAPLPDDDPAGLALLVHSVRRLLPGLDPLPISTERCRYDNTADADFVLDRVGHIVVGFGTSGHGFKFGPLLGDLLADLATDTPPAIDLSPFRLRRANA